MLNSKLEYIIYKAILISLLGLVYIHSAHILHRDIKPGNILVNSNCLIKVSISTTLVCYSLRRLSRELMKSSVNLSCIMKVFNIFSLSFSDLWFWLGPYWRAKHLGQYDPRSRHTILQSPWVIIWRSAL